MQSYVLSDTEMVAGTLKCDCPLACDVVSYETTTTTAAFPNPSLIKILQTRGNSAILSNLGNLIYPDYHSLFSEITTSYL